MHKKNLLKNRKSEIRKIGKSEIGNPETNSENPKFGNEFGNSGIRKRIQKSEIRKLNRFCKIFGKSDVIAQAWLRNNY